MEQKLTLITSACFAAFLSACASSGPSAGVTPPKINPSSVITLKGSEWEEWKELGDIRDTLGSKVKITQSGDKITVDLGGSQIDGTKMKHSSDSQNEKNPGIRNRIKFLTVRNGYIYNLSGGFSTNAQNTTLENITFTGNSEDFISNIKDVAPNIIIKNCKFYNNENGDKSVQINDFRNALIENNFIAGGITAIRAQESSAKYTGKGIIQNNEIVNVPTFINAAGKTEITVKNNKLTDVGQKYVNGSDVKIIEK